MVVSHVSVKVSDGGHNLITIEQFAAFSFDQRMKLLSAKSITFLDEDGCTVPLLEGVKYTTNYLRQNKAS